MTQKRPEPKLPPRSKPRSALIGVRGRYRIWGAAGRNLILLARKVFLFSPINQPRQAPTEASISLCSSTVSLFRHACNVRPISLPWWI